MTIEQLKSGSYRIRQYYNGKRYSVTVDYKPNKKQAIELLADVMKDTTVKKDRVAMNFKEAYDSYVDIKSNVLSPSTIRGYESLIKNIPDSFLTKRLYDIDQTDVQKVINDYSSTHSPKSTSNVYGLISVVLKMYRENMILKVQLPQKIKNEPYIPTDEEVKRIMDEIRETKYYIPTVLAALGMRKSEICGLDISDLHEDNSLTISKALVKDKEGNQVLKTTKTTDSSRTIYIPSDVADLIRKQGYVYKGFPDSITRNLVRTQDKLHIQHFPLHKLRHFFVSYAHNELHLSDAQIMEAGGWKSPDIMRSVYRHSMKEEEAKKNIAVSMNKLF